MAEYKALLIWPKTKEMLLKTKNDYMKKNGELIKYSELIERALKQFRYIEGLNDVEK